MLRYTIEDDGGKVINPLLPAGQIVGGVAQGLGQTLGEQAVCAGRRRAHICR